jgi:cyclic beta-1,2-glucan synthetase
MQQKVCRIKHNAALRTQIALYIAGAGAIAACGIAVQQGSAAQNIFTAAFLCMLAAEIIAYGFTRSHLTVTEALQDGLIAGAFAYAATPDLTIWQAPGAWQELFTITSPAAAIACISYLLMNVYCTASKGRHVSPLAGSFVLGVPLLFNGLLLLQSPVLLEKTGRLIAFGASLSPVMQQLTGTALVLVVINEALANALILLLTGRLLADARMHGLLIASGLFAAATPEIAGLGSGPAAAALPPALGALAAISAAVTSQAGLWAQTFLLTGIIMDALHSRQPAWYWVPGHFKSGFTQGAVYGGVFMGLIHAVAGALSVPGVWSLLTQYPVASAGIAGIILFPFIKTIIESFEGSLRFVLRLRNNYGRWDHCLRGGAVGAAIALALSKGLPAAWSANRFLFGVAAGAAAYAGINLVRDFLNAAVLKQRLTMQALRISRVNPRSMPRIQRMRHTPGLE